MAQRQTNWKPFLIFRSAVFGEHLSLILHVLSLIQACFLQLFLRGLMPLHLDSEYGMLLL